MPQEFTTHHQRLNELLAMTTPSHRTHSLLVSFLYELMRSHVPVGVVTQIVGNTYDLPANLTNGALGRLAENLGDMLMRIPKNADVLLRHHTHEMMKFIECQFMLYCRKYDGSSDPIVGLQPHARCVYEHSMYRMASVKGSIRDRMLRRRLRLLLVHADEENELHAKTDAWLFEKLEADKDYFGHKARVVRVDHDSSYDMLCELARNIPPFHE
jgi:hypothetical protein